MLYLKLDAPHARWPFMGALLVINGFPDYGRQGRCLGLLSIVELRTTFPRLHFGCHKVWDSQRGVQDALVCPTLKLRPPSTMALNTDLEKILRKYNVDKKADTYLIAKTILAQAQVTEPLTHVAVLFSFHV